MELQYKLPLKIFLEFKSQLRRKKTNSLGLESTERMRMTVNLKPDSTGTQTQPRQQLQRRRKKSSEN